LGYAEFRDYCLNKVPHPTNKEISLGNHKTRKKHMKPKNYIKIVYNA